MVFKRYDPDEEIDGLLEQISELENKQWPTNEEIRKILLAARHIDWTQVVLNLGPPCFHIEHKRGGANFCMRAKRWEGHHLEGFHKYVSLHALVQRLALQSREQQ